MVRPRLLSILMLVLAVSAVLAPAALAGGSAGDNQYTDPLTGSHHRGGSQTSSSPPSPAPATGATGTTTASAPPPPTTPTATAATSSTTPAPTAGTTAGARTLPFTGYSDWEAGALGALLVIGGLGLRRRVRA